MTCSRCDKPTQEEFRYCSHCAVRDPRLCTRCYTPINRGSGTCSSCHARADNAITFTAPAGHLRDLAPAALPAGEHPLADRLAQLADRERHLLQLAAVIGSTFSTGELQCMIRHQSLPLSLDKMLGHLEKQGFIIRKAGHEEKSEWRFRFQLIRAMLCRELSHDERRELHALAAECIETLLPTSSLPVSRKGRHAEQLARHYEQADAPESALTYRIEAAREAAGRYDINAALLHSSQALKLVEASPAPWHHQLAVHELLADVHLLHGRLDEARTEYRQAIEITNLPEVRVVRRGIALHRKMAGLEERRGNPRVGRQWLSSAMILLEFDPAAKESLESARLYEEAGWHFFRRGDRQKAQGFFEQALPLLPEPRHPRERASLYNRMAHLHWTHGEVSRAESLARESLHLAGAADDLHGIATACLTLASFLYDRGGWQEALDLAGRALILGQRIGAWEGECEARLVLATLFLAKGEIESALAESRKAVECAERFDLPRLRSMAYRHLAAIRRHRGEVRNAYFLLLQALEHAHQLQEPREEVPCHIQYAEILLSLGKLRDAYDEVQQAVAAADELQLPLARAAARRSLGNYYAALGDSTSAERQYRHALQQYTTLDFPFEAARSELALAQLYWSNGVAGKARAFQQRAWQRLVALGAAHGEPTAPPTANGWLLFPVDRAMSATTDCEITG